MKRSGVRLSVCLSRHSTAAAACGGFAAERRAGKRYRSTAAGARQQRRRSSAVLIAELTRPNTGLLAVADLEGGCGGCGRTPLGVLQKNSWSTNFENSEDSRQHDYYYYQFLPCS